MMERGVTSQGMQAASRVWKKARIWILPLDPLEGMEPWVLKSSSFDFIPRRPLTSRTVSDESVLF